MVFFRGLTESFGGKSDGKVAGPESAIQVMGHVLGVSWIGSDSKSKGAVLQPCVRSAAGRGNSFCVLSELLGPPALRV